MTAHPTLADTMELIVRLYGRTTDRHGLLQWKHPFEVMMALPDGATREEQHVALLHDVVEGELITDTELLDLGYSTFVVDTVGELTRPKGVFYPDYIASIQTRSGLRVKLADNLVNRSRAPGGPNWDGMTKRYVAAEIVLRRNLSRLLAAA